MHIGKVHNFKF